MPRPLRVEVVHTRDELQNRVPARGCVFVPTMGALHAGHAALVEQGVREASRRGFRAGCVVSIFVNPTQFNEKADYDRYPRDVEKDAGLCAKAGAAIVFAPPAEAVYPPGEAIPVPALPEVARRPGLEDAFRPGHFAGVCQVVTRLFELVRPGAAVFGEKDWQQLQVVRAMAVRAFPSIDIVAGATVREGEGLAMSSRNAFLSREDRSRALAISRALRVAGDVATPVRAEEAMRAELARAGVSPEYAVVRDAETLRAPREGRAARALIAARVGKVRLIDNAPWPSRSGSLALPVG